MAKSIVEEYWRGVAERLHLEASRMNTHSGHNGERGRANENSLARLLTSLIPEGYGVGSGVVFNHTGSVSNQSDVIIYSSVDQPRIMAQSDQYLFPVETVQLIVEVKTRLTKNEIVSTGEKIKTMRTLAADRDIHYSLFAYSCGNNHPKTLMTVINSMAAEERPDSVCILQPATFGNNGSCALVPRHQINQSDPMSRQWEVVNVKDYRPEVQFSVNLSVNRSSNKIVTEPGRALLLYAEVLVKFLSNDTSHWFSRYLPDISREVLSVDDWDAMEDG